MKRVEFLNPEADVIEFETKDVITLSLGGDEDGNLEDGGGDHEDGGNLYG